MNTIKQITEENSKGIHSMFNACMHKAECCSKDDEIADLKRLLESARGESLQWKANSRENRLIAEQCNRELEAAMNGRSALLAALDTTVKAIMIFRNEPMLERLHGLRSSDGYGVLQQAMDIGRDAIEQEKSSVCQTCKGRGVIGGFVSIEAGYQDDPCPECSVSVIDAPEAIESKEGGAA